MFFGCALTYLGLFHASSFFQIFENIDFIKVDSKANKMILICIRPFL